MATRPTAEKLRPISLQDLLSRLGDARRNALAAARECSRDIRAGLATPFGPDDARDVLKLADELRERLRTYLALSEAIKHGKDTTVIVAEPAKDGTQ